jgi:DNA-binding IclR family transcriptional regulator
MAEVEKSSVVKSADRALALLEYLAASSEPKRFAEISKELGIPRSSLHGLLKTMQDRKWIAVDEEEGSFRIGPQSLAIGATYLATEHIVRDFSSLLDELSKSTEETIHLGVLKDDEVMYLAKRDAKHSLRLVSGVGVCLPAHATALGKLLLSQMDPSEVKKILKMPLQKLTTNTLTDFELLDADFQKIRSRGYAEDNEESTYGVRCFSVGIGVEALHNYAISCSVPVARLTKKLEKKVIESLQSAVGAQATASIRKNFSISP